MNNTLPPEELLVHTLGLLEWRLNRLEFLLDGGVSQTKDISKEGTVLSRIRKMEHALQQLSLKSDTVKILLNLESRFPFLLAPDAPPPPSDDLNQNEKLSMVLAEATTYSTVSSQLRALGDVSLPPTDSFAKMVALQPRMEELNRTQYEQAMEISELRKRSAILVSRWHEVFILGQGRCTAEWDSKLRNAEREVRREEIRNSQD
ncbi:nuclear distribution protein RO10 [Venturia nashicola]|uniref:Nuclear distribution protein RO10 n=1 Tax=Venturia nashicola TaxID=86259 RepID=A0A4Z1P737_9PEZI|nr:nuclear distribution protein RO10 [Venturia nashicola]